MALILHTAHGSDKTQTLTASVPSILILLTRLLTSQGGCPAGKRDVTPSQMARRTPAAERGGGTPPDCAPVTQNAVQSCASASPGDSGADVPTWAVSGWGTGTWVSKSARQPCDAPPTQQRCKLIGKNHELEVRKACFGDSCAPP